MSSDILIRNARISDAQGVSALIDLFARKGLMLPKPVDTIIEGIRNFIIALNKDEIIGCCAIAFFSQEIAEVRSLAVREDFQKRGIGRLLVEKAEEILREEGIKTAFALTYSDLFFENLGYSRVDKMKFPQKIWRDCMGCPKLVQCDEIAMEKELF